MVLFSSVAVLAVGQFAAPGPSRRCIEELILMGGGTVVSSITELEKFSSPRSSSEICVLLTFVLSECNVHYIELHYKRWFITKSRVKNRRVAQRVLT